VTHEKAASGDVMPHKFIAFDVRITRKTRLQEKPDLKVRHRFPALTAVPLPQAASVSN
jgi:hypothetical protein